MPATRKICLILLLGICLSTTSIRPAQAADGKEIGLWTGAVFCSLLYTPIKGVVALLMGLGGGLSFAGTYPAGTPETSWDIIHWGFYGDWLIRPDHLMLENYPQILGFDGELHFIE